MNKYLARAAFAAGIVSSAAAFAADKTVTLAVNNMDCAACPSIVKGSLEAVPGVTKVAVSYKDKTATIIYDDSKADGFIRRVPYCERNAASGPQHAMGFAQRLLRTSKMQHPKIQDDRVKA